MTGQSGLITEHIEKHVFATDTQIFTDFFSDKLCQPFSFNSPLLRKRSFPLSIKRGVTELSEVGVSSEQ